MQGIHSKIILSPSDSKKPFILKRRQFPISVCFAMTINKSQGQSLDNVGLYLQYSVMDNYMWQSKGLPVEVVFRF